MTNRSRVNNKFIEVDPRPTVRAKHHLRGLPDGLMKELLDKITVPGNTVDHDDNNIPLLDQQPAVQVGTAYSIVELPKPGASGQDIQQETEEANIRSVSDSGMTAS